MNNEEYYRRSIYTAIRIGFIALLLVWSFFIVRPFIMPVLWGLIIAVTIYPVHQKLSEKLGGKRNFSASLITLLLLAILIVPSAMFVDSTVDGVQNVVDLVQSGKSFIPHPPEDVLNWKFIGKPVYEIWSLASESMVSVIVKLGPQLKELAPAVLSVASSLGATIFMFLISIVIGGALLNQGENAEKTSQSIFNTLLGKQGKEFVKLSVATIRSVVQGVLGVAIIQSLLAGIGFWAIGMPFAGLWTLIILFVAIMQLPAILVFLPLIVYSFSFADTTPAIIFTIWSLLVGLVDNVLKPMLLGRGVDAPMLVILLGGIGGMMMSGIIGLFVGAVVLALSYKVFVAIFVEDILDE